MDMSYEANCEVVFDSDSHQNRSKIGDVTWEKVFSKVTSVSNLASHSFFADPVP